MRNRRRWLVVVALTALSAACSRSTPSPPDPPPHVFLVLLDTLRADHLGLYGYERDTSPALDRFAESAVVFERAQSQAPCTFPSANSILTGRYPGHFLLQPEGSMGIPESIVSLPRILRGEGYETLAISASPIVRMTPTVHNPVGGFDAGFATFDESCLWNRASCVNGVLMERLDAASSTGKPLFVYLHFMDAHDPYVLPDGHELVFASPYEGDKPAVAAGRPGLAKKNAVELDATDIAHFIDLYDERIRYLDGKLESLFTALDERGLLDTSIIVIASDHGEQFEEHGAVAHCNALYREELETPLILRLPDGPAGRRETLVSNVDIVPTILDYAGVNASSHEVAMDGRSLRGIVEDEAGGGGAGAGAGEVGRERELAYALWGQGFSVRDERYKLITFIRDKRTELYDLVENPEERPERTRGRAHAADRERLAGELQDWLRNRSGVDEMRAGRAGEIAIEQLRALGYIP